MRDTNEDEINEAPQDHDLKGVEQSQDDEDSEDDKNFNPDASASHPAKPPVKRLSEREADSIDYSLTHSDHTTSPLFENRTRFSLICNGLIKDDTTRLTG